MKLVIITIHSAYPNYGNKLQNYATQEVLKKYSENVVTLSFEPQMVNLKQMIKYILQQLSGFRLKGDKDYFCYYIPRVKRFYDFNKKYIHFKRVETVEEAKRIKADYYIVGSDQVWNPLFYRSPLYKEMYLATFIPSNKKISWSSSFGIDNLPRDWRDFFCKNLREFKALSVREKRGAEIVEELIGHSPEVLIDPTLMLGEEEWLRIAKKPKDVDVFTPYILTYFLGDNNESTKRDVDRISKEYGLRVYRLFDLKQPEVYLIDPCEFIFMIANARCVMTDSFHACVFSFLFQRPFLVYKRKGANMMSRIQTLLEKFDLERKYVDSGLPNDLFECNYRIGYQRLEEERKKVHEFLKKYLN